MGVVIDQHLNCSCGDFFYHILDFEDEDGTITAEYFCDSCKTLFYSKFIPGRLGTDEEDTPLEHWYESALNVPTPQWEGPTINAQRLNRNTRRRYYRLKYSKRDYAPPIFATRVGKRFKLFIPPEIKTGSEMEYHQAYERLKQNPKILKIIE